MEKQTLTSLEKKLAEEKKQRSDFQLKLETERKSKKEANAERNLAQAQQSANSACVQKLEAEIAKLRDELARTEQRANTAEEVRIACRTKDWMFNYYYLGDHDFAEVCWSSW